MKQTKKQMPLGFYRLLLIAAAAIWGIGFIIAKDAINQAGAPWVIGLRFLGSGIILCIVLFPFLKKHHSKSLIKAGIIIGSFSFLGFATQFVGLSLTTPSKNAFLSSCYCVTVPFIWWFLVRKRPTTRNFLAAVICMFGIGFVSLEGDFSITLGDGISILSAFAYGIEIVVISLFMKDHNVFAITAIQQLTAGILGCTFALITQPLPDWGQLATSSFVLDMIYVIVLAATCGSLAQNIAQQHLSASDAGIICSLECVFCAISSIVFIGEAFTLKLLVGFILIFASVIIAQGKGPKILSETQ